MNHERRYASIDVGTNSVLLLIAEVENGRLKPIRQKATITRLGEGTSVTGVLTQKAMDRTLKALQEYKSKCESLGVVGITALGTAALRRASNAKEFLERVQKELGLTIEIISKEREAHLTYLASEESFGSDIVVMDIGGGSTEFITVDHNRKIHPMSLELGVVMLTERFFKTDPVTEDELSEAQKFVRSTLEQKLDKKLFTNCTKQMVATAGTATTLAAMHYNVEPFDPDLVHGKPLTRDNVESLIQLLKGKTTEQIGQIDGVQKGREDVILAGSLIFSEAMKALNFPHVTVSDRGVRWGALLENRI